MIMGIENMIEKYSWWMEFSKIKIKPSIWVSISLAVTIVIAFITWIVSALFIHEANLLPVAFGLATFVLMVGYPYMKFQSIIDSIESNFSDALKQMADTLKAGDTYESALREVANSEYGRLSEEMELALRRLEEGENLDTSLRGFAERIDSKTVKRTIAIILDSVRTGASLADILDEIADDVRDYYRLKENRKANTTMQFIFMVAAGGIIAPAIFGEINAVMKIFSAVSMQAVTPAQKLAADGVSNFILTLIQLYIIIEVLASGIMMAIIRDGKINKSIIYIPILLLLAFVSYYLASILTNAMIASAI
jgi:archaeal flagellar protein FlaJ